MNQLLSLNQAANEACRDLPDGWTLELYMEKGSGYLTLTNPAGDEVFVPGSCDDFSLDVQFAYALKVANGTYDLMEAF